MALGDGVRARLAELAAREPDIGGRIAAIAEGATVWAVEEAVARTPPNTFGDGEVRGVHTLTGQMAQQFAVGSGSGDKQPEMLESWKTASQTTPTVAADGYRTALANDMQYASYVNDGHRVDKHFVPGLYIDPATGLLSMDPGKPKGVGLVVGTKTTYVEGLHITDAAKEVYEEVAETELDKLTREVFK